MAKTKVPTFEERLQRLQEIVSSLEKGDLTLEDSVTLYKEGLMLTKACREQLATARNEVKILSDGEFRTFDPDDDEEKEI